MKKFGGLMTGFALAASVLLAMPAQKVSAACNNTTSFGSVMLYVPTLPKTGDYALWVRMQSMGTSGKVLIEANENACFDVTVASMPANQWTWQAYRSAQKIQLVRFANTDGNALEVIGVQAGVKVDKVMLTKPDCVPHEFGDNCADAIQLTNLGGDGSVTPLPSPSNDPVSGKVSLSSTPERFTSRLDIVTYTVQGRTVQSSKSPQPFDTTLVANGKHTVLIETTLADGKTIRESVVIEVDNLEHPFSPVTRWLRVNIPSVKLGGIILISAILAIVALQLLRNWHRQRREMQFRGF